MSYLDDDSDDALADVVKSALSRKGVLNALKAKLRAEIFHVLENKEETVPEKTKEVFLAAEIVRDFLSLLKLDNTLSVFMEEVGQPAEVMVDRQFVAGEMGLISKNESIPLLVLLIDHLIQEKKTRDSKFINSTNVSYDPNDY